MSKYELLAISIAGISLLIQIVEKIYKKYIVKPKIEFYDNGKISLYSNFSGSYIRFDGVINVLHSCVFIKGMHVKIRRLKDDNVLKLNWSTINSPFSQKYAGNYMYSQEQTHPLKIDPNKEATMFLEYTDPYDSVGAEVHELEGELEQIIHKIIGTGADYQEAYEKYKTADVYKQVYNLLSTQMFWEVGKYEMELFIEYENKCITFRYSFDVTIDDRNRLKHNLREAIDSYIKEKYGLRFNYLPVNKDVIRLLR